MSTGRFHDINSTPSWKAEICSKARGNRQGPFVTERTSKRGTLTPAGWRGAQLALGKPAKSPEPIPGIPPGRPKCQQSWSRKTLLLIGMIHLRSSEFGLLKFLRPFSALLLSSKQFKDRFSCLNLPPVKYLPASILNKIQALRFFKPTGDSALPSGPQVLLDSKGGAGQACGWQWLSLTASHLKLSQVLSGLTGR